MIDLTAIDDAILAKLRATNVFRAVKTLDAQDLVTEDIAPMPSAHTMIGRANYLPPEGRERRQVGTLGISVFVRTRNLRGDGSVRKNADGAYELINAVATALLGYIPAPCGELYLQQISPVRVDRLLAIYEVALLTDIEEDY